MKCSFANLENKYLFLKKHKIYQKIIFFSVKIHDFCTSTFLIDLEDLKTRSSRQVKNGSSKTHALQRVSELKGVGVHAFRALLVHFTPSG